MELADLPNGFYGWTYSGEDYMQISRNISYEKARETILHELIHTPDEYETRIITRWMIDNTKKKYDSVPYKKAA